MSEAWRSFSPDLARASVETYTVETEHLLLNACFSPDLARASVETLKAVFAIRKGLEVSVPT